MTTNRLRVVTFNAGAGNPRVATDQRDFLKLPFYQEIVHGCADAPLLAVQEVGAEQAKALEIASANGNFEVIHIHRPGQGNALLVPSRFEVLSKKSRFLVGSQLKGLWRAVAAWLERREAPDWRQLGELRMWIEAELRDRRSGRVFTIFNTHLSGYPRLRLEQARALFRPVRRAMEEGPVILAGDLNTRTAETATPEQDAVDSQVRTLFGPLRDAGELSPDRAASTVDYVLVHGFTAVASRVYTGSSLALPGRPTAEVISDHYAEEDILRFA